MVNFDNYECDGQMSIYDFPECLPEDEFRRMHIWAMNVRNTKRIIPEGIGIAAIPYYWFKYLKERVLKDGYNEKIL